MESIIKQFEDSEFWNTGSIFITSDKKPILIGANKESDRSNCPNETHVYSVCECYRYIFSRDLEFINRFRDAVPLRDELGIAHVLLSSIQGIEYYNSLQFLPDLKMLDRQLNIAFLTSAGISELVERLLIPFLKITARTFGKISWYFQYKRSYDNINSFLYLSILTNDISEEKIVSIQKYLYNHSSEFKLSKIYFPCDNLFISQHKTLSEEIITATERFLSILSEEIIIQIKNYKGESLNNSLVTQAIYVILKTATIFFNDLDHFKLHLRKHYNTAKTEATSMLTFNLIDNREINNYCDKIESEYRKLHKNLLKEFYDNFYGLITDWNISDLEPEYRNLLQIREKIEENKDEYLGFLLKTIFDCFDIDKYYRGFILYVLLNFTV